MKRKFITSVLVLGVLLSIDCKELMRYEKVCPVQKLATNKNVPPCHGVEDKSEKSDCDCKNGEKAIIDKSDFVFQIPIFIDIYLFDKQSFKVNLFNLSIVSSLVNYKIPLPFFSNISTTHLLI